MILLFPGMHKTGTTCLWTTLQKHPEIECSFEKEPVVNFWKNSSRYEEEDYYKNWLFKEETKVIFDGSGTDAYFNKLSMLNNFERIDSIKLLFTIRGLAETLVSYIYFFYWIYKKYKEENLYYNDHLIDLEPEYIEYIIKNKYFFYSRLKYLEPIIGNENICVVNTLHLNENQKDIYKFLSVDETPILDFQIQNKTNIEDMNFSQSKIYFRIFRIVNKFRKELQQKEKEELKKIQKEFNFLG